MNALNEVGVKSSSSSSSQSNDSLNSPNYSPILHLNALFPSSANLQRIGDLSTYVELYASSLEAKQKRLVNANDDDRSFSVIAKASEEVKVLSDEIESLRNNSLSTDKAITDMTLDIKKLDNTKANLIQSITVLKRLQMLTTAYNQLSTLVSRRQYKEMTQTLPAVMELMAHFRQFRSISQIATLSKQVSDIQIRISDQIFSDFAAVIEHKSGSGGGSGMRSVSGTTNNLNGANNGNTIANGVSGPTSSTDIASSLADACIVLDNLSTGSNSRERLISWYCNVQLKEYRTIFRSSDEAGSLENISRRYAYLKRLLKTHTGELSRYFSPSWNVTEELCKRFCMTTRDDIQGLLASSSSREVDVQLLLSALNETLEFEQYLEKRFHKNSPSTTTATTSSFTNAISSAFQPHLNIWIQFQDKALASKFQEFRSPVKPHENNDGDNENEPTVLPSSADLFIFYRSVLTQTAKLSTREPLLQLSNLFAKWLMVYSNQILRSYIPDKISSTDDIRTTCLVVATADYCFNTTAQLEQKLIEQIDEEFKSKVDLEREKGLFLELINSSIRNLVIKVQSGCEFAWREMANTNWSKVDTVGDQSPYVADLQQNILRDTKAIIDHMSKDVHCRMLCDKIVEALTNDFLQSVVRCRPISEVAAEQMLLDLYVLKGCFLNLPLLKDEQQNNNTANKSNKNDSSANDATNSVAIGRNSMSLGPGGAPNTNSNPSNGGDTGNSSSPAVSSAYVRHVGKSLSRVETILKVILTQSTPAEGLVQNYFYLVGDKSGQNFTKILELKGISTHSGQTRFLEMFYSHLKAHDNLINESPILSNLRFSRMIPTRTASGGGISNLSNSGTTSSSGNISSGSNLPYQNGSHHHFEPKSLGTSLLSKEGFERFAHGAEAPVNKFNENFRNIGRLFRRDGSGSPLGGRNNNTNNN